MQTPAETSDSNFRRFAAVAVFLLVITGATFAWQRFTSVYHLATVQPGVLYRDGARSTRELEMAIAKVHPRTVVCLVDDGEISDPAKPQFKEEFVFLQKQGITIDRLPVRLGGWPGTQDVQRFLATATVPANQPVLVHCAQGVRRTAMMVAAYQESVLGYDKERAKAEILTFGHSEKTIADIRRFIDAYDAKARTVPTELGQGK